MMVTRKHRPTSAQGTIRREAFEGVEGPFPPAEAPTRADTPSALTKRPETGDHMKLDHGKAPWHLAPWDAFLAIVQVLAFGAMKYRERGWEEGMAWHRCYSAAMRHLTDWFMRVDKGKGPGRDADTGYSDLWHAGCCVCFLIAYEIRGCTAGFEGPTQVPFDTRPEVPRLPMPTPPEVGK